MRLTAFCFLWRIAKFQPRALAVGQPKLPTWLLELRTPSPKTWAKKPENRCLGEPWLQTFHPSIQRSILGSNFEFYLPVQLSWQLQNKQNKTGVGRQFASCHSPRRMECQWAHSSRGGVKATPKSAPGIPLAQPMLHVPQCYITGPGIPSIAQLQAVLLVL